VKIKVKEAEARSTVEDWAKEKSWNRDYIKFHGREARRVERFQAPVLCLQV
jgi:hypothetical protein